MHLGLALLGPEILHLDNHPHFYLGSSHVHQLMRQVTISGYSWYMELVGMSKVDERVTVLTCLPSISLDP